MPARHNAQTAIPENNDTYITAIPYPEAETSPCSGLLVVGERRDERGGKLHDGVSKVYALYRKEESAVRRGAR